MSVSIAAGQGPADLATGVRQRLRPALILWALGILAIVWLAAEVQLIGMPTAPTIWKSRLIIEPLCVTSLVLAAVVADEFVDRGMPPVVGYTLATVTAAAFAAVGQQILRQALGWQIMRSDDPLAAMMVPVYVGLDVLMYGGLGMSIYANQRAAAMATERRRRAERSRAEADRRTTQARLAAMQARVEPQFLFGTLARVRDLYERDAEHAGALLDDLIAYLRAALPRLRGTTSTLGVEIELARAYLEIRREREPERLQVAFDVPQDLHERAMPPMVLLPLLQRALLGAPSRVDVSAASSDDGLRLSVSVHGGTATVTAADPMLADIDERLRALQGGASVLSIMQTHCTRFEVFVEGSHPADTVIAGGQTDVDTDRTPRRGREGPA